VVGLLIYWFYHPLQEALIRIVERISLRVIVFLLIVTLGLISSIISAILAAIILVEIVNAQPVVKKPRWRLWWLPVFPLDPAPGLRRLARL
jgi:predicted cation transporter